MKNLSIILLLLVCLLGCKSNKTNTAANPEPMKKSYLEVAKEELGEQATCEESSDKAYVLCKYIDKNATPPMATKNAGVTNNGGNPKSKGGLGRVKYFVWNTSEGTIVTKGTLVSGSIIWHSNTEVKIVETKGANLPAAVFLYDVVTKQKSDLSNSKP